jgi:hypothetical protein
MLHALLLEVATVTVCVIRTNRMHTFTLIFYFNYSAFGMFRAVLLLLLLLLFTTIELSLGGSSPYTSSK